MAKKLSFVQDYMEGAHPQILQHIFETNYCKPTGCGTSPFSETAREKFCLACEAPDADSFFLVGGTQTNVTIIDAVLRSYEGVIAAQTVHISVHEADAIEFVGIRFLLCHIIKANFLPRTLRNILMDLWQIVIVHTW